MRGSGVGRERPTETVAYWIYRSARWVATAFPESLGRTVFDAVSHVAFRSAGRMRATVIENQAQILGRDPSDRLVIDSAEEAFELYARYWFDSFRIAVWSAEELDRRLEVTGAEHLDAALAAGRGCVVALGHSGNWDVAGAWVAGHGYPVTSVNEELRPPRLFDLFRAHREGFGVRILSLKAPNVAAQLAAALAENRVVALLADRDLTGRGVEVEMFGRTRRIPAGPAHLALTSGAPLLLAAVSTTERGWRLRMSPPIEVERSGDLKEDIRALTHRLATALERVVAERPADWHVFQPAWP